MDSPVSDPPSPLQSSTRSRTRGQNSRRAHKEKSSLASTSKELVRLLVHEEQESQDLRNTLHDLTERLKDETQRADNAEQRAREVVVRFREANEGRLTAQQEAARASEELRLYKLQLENAQREILRAQELLDALEAQKNEAEEAAARARTTARKLKEEKIVQLAREQGRLEGIKEGIERGKSYGYEEGRTEGFARGRAAAAKEFTQKGINSREGNTITATDGSMKRNVPLPPPSPPADSPPGHENISLPRPEAIQIHPPPSRTPPGPPLQPDARPVSVYNLPRSPQHTPVDYPPDGWVPVIDGDQRIRLPPPHELAPSPYSPRNSPPPIHLQHTPDLAHESPALMIPPPVDRHETHSDTDSITTSTGARQRRPLRRRKSNDSASTTLSQFDLIGPPVATSARSQYGTSRHNVLSAIVEERSPSIAPSSYAPLQSATPVIPIPVTLPTPQAPAPIPLDRGQIQMEQHDYYTRPGSRSSPESIPRNSPPHIQERQTSSPKGSMLSSNSIYITVEPPSRPESGRSGIEFPQDGLLSANDAEHTAPAPVPSPPSNQSVSGQPIILSSGQLPPGFIAVGPPAQTQRADPVHPPQQAAEKPSSGPGAPPSGAPSIYQFYAPPTVGTGGSQQATTPVVIPPPSNAGPRRYSRTALTKESSSDSDEGHAAVSSQLSTSSMDSFTTPPEKRKPLAGPAYAVAPTPPNVIYPLPPPRSAGSSSTARVPLPASSVGSPNTSVAAKVPLPQSSVGSPRSMYTRGSRPGDSAIGGPSALPMVVPGGVGRR
ncbi:hypothetical protein BC835DRAFT_1420335 [Cytidiella melzeri]|nr:hypothetical protein BC835DRAFT_1420335 [Cytidiella melzeri]